MQRGVGRICKICGKKYDFCAHRNANGINEQWRNIYCSESCRKLFHIASDWTSKKISATEARLQLNNINVPPLSNLQPSLRKNIDDIYLESTI